MEGYDYSLVMSPKDTVLCALCYDAPCDKACGKISPSSLIRSVRFRNELPAVSSLHAAGSPCADCSAPCNAACVRGFDIKRFMQKLDTGSKSDFQFEDKDFDLLNTEICGIPVENPFLLSSSVVGSTYEMCARAFDMGWAGVAYKTISFMDIHEASPRFSATHDSGGSIVGFKNIEQLSDHSVPENLHIFRKLKENYPTKFLLASIMGRNDAEWATLSKLVTEAGADAIELNFSCPNMTKEGTGSDVGQCPDLVEHFTRVSKNATHIPVIAKLTPNVVTMSEAAEAAIRGGADGIAAINTIKSLIDVSMDVKNASVGGYSGQAVKPIGMRFIAELGKNPIVSKKHISAMGGIRTWEDAVQYIFLGANSLQVTTAVMEFGYRIIDDLKTGLVLFLKHTGKTLAQLDGSFLNSVIKTENMERDVVIYPKFIRKFCIGCGRCYLSCRDGGHQAIRFENRTPILIPDKCVGCHLCILVCAENAIESSGQKVPLK